MLTGFRQCATQRTRGSRYCGPIKSGAGIRRIVPQPKLHWSMHLWPGLAQLWLRGSWVGLLVAVGFTALANVLAAATFVWTEWLPSDVRWTALGVMAGIWLLAWIDARADWRRAIAELAGDEDATGDPTEQSDQWFREAQVAYLANDWFVAEQLLERLLKLNPRDAEARLMLATLWRHQNRLGAAIEELNRLERLEAAAPWKSEISWERERIGAGSVIQEQQVLNFNAAANQAPATTADTSSRLAA